MQTILSEAIFLVYCVQQDGGTRTSCPTAATGTNRTSAPAQTEQTSPSNNLRIWILLAETKKNNLGIVVFMIN